MSTLNCQKKRKKLLKNKEMLTDISIDTCQRMLRKQFSVRSGLQHTILGQKLMFKEQDEKFVQILHNSSFHWMTVSNINCEKNKVNYYDSLFHGKIKDHIKMHVCNLYKCPEDEVVIKVRICQQKTNAVDCGVYAVANAFYILTNVDISSRHLKESAMRNHFLQ